MITLANIDRVVFALQDAIVNHSVASQAFPLIAKGMELVEQLPLHQADDKKALLFAAFERIAMGQDGMSGTSDDLIPADVLANIRLLLDAHLIEQFADVWADATKGKVSVEKAKPVAVGCFTLLKGVWKAYKGRPKQNV
jgi:hypothetical protein